VIEAKLVRERRDQWRARLINSSEKTHMRIITQVAVLGAVGDVLVDFIAEMWPEHADTIQNAVDDATSLLTGGVVERSDLVAESAPFHQMAISIKEGLVAKEAVILPRGHNPESVVEQSIPSQLYRNVPVIGY
jgi:hypothetical protein